MQLGSIAKGAAAVALLFLLQPATCNAQDSSCTLPQALQPLIARRYPGAKLVSLADLDADSRQLFSKDHGSACPGLVKVDFYGNGKPAFAMVLTMNSGETQKADLVLAHETGRGWETVLLDTAKSSIPVVWSQAPGEYEDVYGKTKIRATRPVIVFCGYNSWAILYAWTGTNTRKIWLRD